MFKIVFRLLTALVVFGYITIKVLSIISGKDIMREYGREIIIGTALFCLIIVAMYISFALLGIS